MSDEARVRLRMASCVADRDGARARCGSTLAPLMGEAGDGGGHRPPSTAAKVAAWTGLVVHVLLGYFPYLATALMAPPWAVGLLLAWWLLLLVVAFRWRRVKPWWTAGTPLVALASWWVAVTLGGALLGWSP